MDKNKGFIKKFEEILKAEQESAFAYKNVCESYVKRFGVDSISLRIDSIYTVELQHISLANKLLELVHPE